MTNTSGKLWLLEARLNLPAGDDPWEPWYDKMFSVVVRAKSARGARVLAQGDCGSEAYNMFLGVPTCNTTTPWLDKKYSTCKVLKASGAEAVIIRDVWNT